MDFWNVYDRYSIEADFGSARFSLTARQRPHTSMNMIATRSREVGVNELAVGAYDPSGQRYFIAKNVTYDLLLSIYDVNTAQCMFMRLTQSLDRKTLESIGKFSMRLGKPNIEIRLIGLQNADKTALSSLYTIRKHAKGMKNDCVCNLVEADMFGNEQRHVCVDMKTGSSYNLLLENRIYRPGELTNTVKREDFEAKRGAMKPLAVLQEIK